MVSFDQSGASRKLAYLGASLAVGAALAVAGFVVGTDGSDAQAVAPGEEISPRDAMAAVPAVAPARAVRFTPQIPAELLVPPRSVTVALAPLPDPPSARSDTTGSIPAAVSVPVPTPKRRPVVEARPAEPSRPETAGMQIARIKTALRLTPAQEQYWPPVEAALRDIVTQIGHDPASSRGLATSRSAASIDPDRVQRLTSAAMPLIMTFDEAQKREVRRIARNMGLENVASAI